MEGSRPAFPLDGERPGAGVGAPVEEVKGRGYWKLPRELPDLPNRSIASGGDLGRGRSRSQLKVLNPATAYMLH